MAYAGTQEVRRGKFCKADGGVLFVYEIWDLSPQLQAKRLRVLDNSHHSPVDSHEAL